MYVYVCVCTLCLSDLPESTTTVGFGVWARTCKEMSQGYPYDCAMRSDGRRRHGGLLWLLRPEG